MKPMSEKGLVDAYYSIYEEKEVETVEVDIISEQDFDNLIEELIEECIEDEVDLDLLEEAVSLTWMKQRLPLVTIPLLREHLVRMLVPEEDRQRERLVTQLVKQNQT